VAHLSPDEKEAAPFVLIVFGAFLLGLGLLAVAVLVGP